MDLNKGEIRSNIQSRVRRIIFDIDIYTKINFRPPSKHELGDFSLSFNASSLAGLLETLKCAGHLKYAPLEISPLEIKPLENKLQKTCIQKDIMDVIYKHFKLTKKYPASVSFDIAPYVSPIITNSCNSHGVLIDSRAVYHHVEILKAQGHLDFIKGSPRQAQVIKLNKDSLVSALLKRQLPLKNILL